MEFARQISIGKSWDFSGCQPWMTPLSKVSCPAGVSSRKRPNSFHRAAAAAWAISDCCSGVRLVAALTAALGAFGGPYHDLPQSPRRDPHDMDRVADHVGGALLAFGSSGHCSTSDFVSAYLCGIQRHTIHHSSVSHAAESMAHFYPPFRCQGQRQFCCRNTRRCGSGGSIHDRLMAGKEGRARPSKFKLRHYQRLG
jgi:hypothetical protein